MRRRRFRGPQGDGKALSDWAFALAASAIIGSAHLLGGAGQVDLVLLLVMLEGLLLAGFLLFSGAARSRLSAPWRLALPTLLFFAVIAAAAVSLWPGAPFERKGVWDLVGLPQRPAVDRGAVVLEMLKLGGLAAVFLTGFAATGSPSLAQRVLRVLGLSTGLFAAYAFFKFTADPLLQGNRLMAGFGSANTPATLFGISTLLAIANLRTSAIANGGWRRNPDILAWLSLVFSVVALLLTGSRAGAASTVAALVILGLFELFRRSGKLSARGAIGVMGATAALAVLAAYSTRALMPRLEQVSADRDVRVEMVTAHWQVFKEAPLTGYGLGSFRSINATLITPENLRTLFDIGATHNVYVQWLEEAGLFGAVPMFALVGVILAVLLWSGLTSDTPGALWQRTIACCLVLTLMHGWTDYALQVPSFAAALTLALGLGFGLSRRRRTRGAAEERSTRDDELDSPWAGRAAQV
jgi:O-antigen ligase